jgi:3-phosphoshikimate 1-carboxyvinyltransferase
MPAPEPARSIRTSGPLRGEVAAPASKSATNRALFLAALAHGRSRLRGTLVADDTRFMAEALGRLGIAVAPAARGSMEVEGGGGEIPSDRAELFLGNAGTAMRFLAAGVALGSGSYRLDGEPRMRRRPMGELGAALTALGASVAYAGEEGYPPLTISGGPLPGGGTALEAGRSSQFVSALLMIGPCTPRGIDLRLRGDPVSRPYVEMTRELMSRFGGPEVSVEPGRLRVPGGSGYRARDIEIEGDASAAASLFAAAATTRGRIRVTRLRAGSHQPDLEFAAILERMGCRVRRQPDAVEVDVEGATLHGVRADLRDCPDLAPALGAVALFADGPTRVEGAAHLRLKESDRIGDLAAGLRELGAKIEEHPDGFTVTPGPLRGARLNPHRDHRLAMAFTAVGLAVEGVEVEDPACVAKSFPGFFEVIDSLRP